MNWLSYLTPIPLFKGKTSHGEKIEVKEVRGKRYMDIGGYPQSANKYVSAWKQIFRKSSVYDLPDNAKVLLLGLGGGDVVRILEKKKSNWEITAVELEPEVVKAAREYFGLRESEKLKLVVKDASAYMKNNKTKYDLVVVDLYTGDAVPTFVNSNQFLKNIAKAKVKGGATIFNYASHSFTPRDFKNFEMALEKYFEEIKVIKDFGHSFYLAKDRNSLFH